MKKIAPFGMMIMAVLFLSSFAFSQFNPTAADLGTGMVYSEYPQVIPVTPDNAKGLLYDNGPFVTHPGGGPGGSDISFLESPNSTLGFGAQLASGNRMADDFDVPAGGWTIEYFVIYAYQTGSPTTSTITEVNLQIWDGEPGTPGATVIWGDATTNIMTDTYWSNCYRGNSMTNTDRPIMACEAETDGLDLDEGTYWVDYQFNGSLTSGPWAPPITIPGQLETGNALQYTSSGGAWAPANDNGSGLQQGMPFLVYGEGVTPPVLDPPTNLAGVATDQDVHLTWDPPSGGTVEELMYDDGVPSGSYSYNGYTMASRMSPAGGCKILALKYYTTYNATNTGFEPRIFNWEGTAPGTTVLFETTADAVNGDWMEVDISAYNVMVTGDFMAGFGSIYDDVYMGYNTVDNGRAWDYEAGSGTWAAWNETYFIRAIVEYTDGTIVELLPVGANPQVAISPANFVEHPHGIAVSHSNPPVPNFGSRALLGYNAYRETTKLNTTVITDLFYDDLDVDPGTYDYTVTAVYDEGESDPTDPVTIHVAGVSVNETGQTTLRVYPNPTAGFVNINSDVPVLGIEMVSFSGQTVYSNQAVEALTTRINVSNYPSGIYFIKVTTAAGIQTLKITVTR